MALMAIIAINQKEGAGSWSLAGRPPLLLLTVLVFAAAIEILLFYVEKSGTVGRQQMAFTTHGFGCAGIVGWIAIGWLWIRKRNRISLRDVIAGVMLGIPNFFSIYLLLKMLNQGWDGSVMYPMVNVTVLLLSTFVAVIVFREKLNRINWIGIALASASILIIAYAHNAATWKTSF
jgi:drug/metabolite transporter (DMT)-like permease